MSVIFSKLEFSTMKKIRQNEMKKKNNSPTSSVIFSKLEFSKMKKKIVKIKLKKFSRIFKRDQLRCRASTSLF